MAAWERGGRVVKLIGFDAGPRDARRYVAAAGADDHRYVYRYPLRILGWDRAACERRIIEEGLPVPRKSACFFCAAIKPTELRATEPALLRRIVAMEARAEPRLREINGLWGRPVKGLRGAEARPGSMTAMIRSEGLLPEAEIDEIRSAMPVDLATPGKADGPAADEKTRAAWAAALDRLREMRTRSSAQPNAPYDARTRR